MASYSQGPGTATVPFALHAENRDRTVKALIKAGAAADGIVFLAGGKQESWYNTDREVPSQFTSSTLCRRSSARKATSHGASASGILIAMVPPPPAAHAPPGTIDLKDGKSTLFIERLPESYAVWMGRIKPPAEVAKDYGVDLVRFVDELPAVFKDRNPSIVYTLKGTNSDSKVEIPPATFPGLDQFKTDEALLHPTMTELRVFKTEAEIAVLRYVCGVTSRAHIAAMMISKPGLKEYQAESEFMHYCYSQGGCRMVAYVSICASGPNSAVLHYGHQGAPNDRVCQDGDMMLLDMGSQYHAYTSDITHSYPINGKFTEDQKMLYGAVLAGHNAVLAALKPGVAWPDMHQLAERTILEHLVKGGLLKGDVLEMQAAGLGGVFMPHGLGHFMGCDVHDVGGYMPGGPTRPAGPGGLKSLRTARTLEAGQVITVEPGCYFIDSLLDPAMADPALSKYLVVDAIKRFRGKGGVRVEDDMLITATGCESLTSVPRKPEDIEAVMAGAPWPRK